MAILSSRLGFMVALVLASSLVGCASVRTAGDARGEASKWVALAEAALGDGDPTGALQALVKAESIDPELPSLHHVRALAFMEKSDLSSALSSIRRAHDLDPKDSSIATSLGKILMDSNRVAEAEKVLLPAARDPLYRDAYRARTNLGILNSRRGDFAAARLHLDRAIQEAPEQACVAYHVRGQVSMRQGRLREAIRDLERSVQRICAGFAEAHVTLGSALMADRQYERARKQFLETRQRFAGTQWAEAAMERLRNLP